MTFFPFGSVSKSSTETMFINSTQNIETTKVTSHTGLTPPDIQENDILFAALHFTNNENTSPGIVSSSDGFTLITQFGVGNSFVNRHTRSLWYKVASASEPGSYEWTWPTAQWPVFCILALRGINTASPIDDFSTYVDDDAAPITLPSINTSNDNALLVISYSIQASTSVTNLINTAPSGYMSAETGRNVTIGAGSDSNTRYRFEDGYKFAGPAGATGTQSFTFSTSDPNSNAPAAIMVAFNPA